MALVQAISLSAEPRRQRPAYDDHVGLMHVRDVGGNSHPIRSQKAWQSRRSHILEGLQKVMGRLPDRTHQTSLDVRHIESTQIGTITRQKLTYQTDHTGRVAAYLFLPEAGAQTTPGPAVLCLQQTNRAGKLEPAGIAGNPELAHALHLARRGYVTLAPDYPGFGESNYDFSARHGYASGSMKAVWDNIRSVDFLLTLKQVDSERIGVIGHSLGGHNAMFTAAFDTRLRVIVSNSGFTRFHKDDVPSWTGPRYMPFIRTRFGNEANQIPFDFPEIIGSFAPRPFLAIAPKRDRDFDYTGVLDSIDAARPVYQLYAATASLQGVYPDLKHSFPATSRARADKFLDTHLQHTPPK